MKLLTQPGCKWKHPRVKCVLHCVNLIFFTEKLHNDTMLQPYIVAWILSPSLRQLTLLVIQHVTEFVNMAQNFGH